MAAGLLTDLLKLAYWRHVVRVASRMPVSLVRAAAFLAAAVEAAAAGRKKEIFLSEMRKCGLAGDGGSGGLFFRSIRNHISGNLKMCYLRVLGPKNVGGYLDVEGGERLDAALSGGRGAVLLNPHFGPFLLVMPALGHRGYALSQVALQGEADTGGRTGLKCDIYEAKFDAIERRMPVRFINAAESRMALREVLRDLAENRAVLFASTGRGGTAWNEMDFLGRRARFNLTPFKLALKTSSPILPVFVMNTKRLARVRIEAPIVPREGETAEELAGRYTGILESYVRRYPEHFAYFLYEMFIYAGWDDHPFFLDYDHIAGGAVSGARPLKKGA